MADPDYFTLDEFRELPQMGDTDKYSDDRINAVAASLTAIIEREVGTSFVARTVTETVDGPHHSTDLALRSPYVLALTSLSVDDAAVDSDAVTLRGGVIRYLAGQWWTWGIGNVAVTYESGYSNEPPADIKEALMWAARDRLMATSATAGIDARRTSLITEQGTVNYVLAGENRPTGYPELDAAILGWKAKLSGFGFA